MAGACLYYRLAMVCLAGTLISSARANCAPGFYIFPATGSCVPCTGCISGKFVGRPCNGVNNTVCHDCTTCDPSTQYQVSACGSVTDARCANTSQIVLAQMTLDGGVAASVYNRNFNALATATTATLRTHLDLNVASAGRLTNVSLAVLGTAVVTTFSVLPDLSYWDNCCVLSSGIVLTGVTSSGWAVAGSPLEALGAVILSHLNTTLRASRTITSINVTMDRAPDFTSVFTAGAGFAPSFASVSFTFRVVGVNCRAATAATTNLTDTRVLRAIQSAPVNLVTASAINTQASTPVATAPPASVLFSRLAASVGAGNVSALVVESSGNTLIPATSAALLRDEGGASRSGGSNDDGWEFGDQWWHYLILGILGLLLIAILLMLLAMCHERSEHKTIVHDKIVNRGAVKQSPTIQHDPYMAQPTQPVYNYAYAPPAQWPPHVNSVNGGGNGSGGAFGIARSGYNPNLRGDNMYSTTTTHPNRMDPYDPRTATYGHATTVPHRPLALGAGAGAGVAYSDYGGYPGGGGREGGRQYGGLVVRDPPPRDYDDAPSYPGPFAPVQPAWRAASEPGIMATQQPQLEDGASVPRQDPDVDYFDLDNADLPSGLDGTVRDPIIRARQRSIQAKSRTSPYTVQ
eukprot:m.108030 g.108030  ORF g.108030 m.108030 type:complete len:632 (+) comp10642_c1_seq2:161-2056(+)